MLVEEKNSKDFVLLSVCYFCLKAQRSFTIICFLVLEPAAPLVMLMALDPLAAGCVHVSGTVRADE